MGQSVETETNKYRKNVSLVNNKIMVTKNVSIEIGKLTLSAYA